MTTNLEKCLTFMSDNKPKASFNNVVLGIETEEELLYKLNLIPEISKDCIVAKWGLDGSKPCASYKALDEKLHITNSRKLYTEALTELSKTRYIYILTEEGPECIYKDYTPAEFFKAVNCAYLRWATNHKIESCDATVSEVYDDVEEMFSRLTEREEKILNLRFGFHDGKWRCLEDVGEQFHVTRERVRQIESKALRRLRRIQTTEYPRL